MLCTEWNQLFLVLFGSFMPTSIVIISDGYNSVNFAEDAKETPKYTVY